MTPRNWFRLFANAALRLVTNDDRRSDISESIAHRDPNIGRYQWRCHTCGRWYAWSVPGCPEDGTERPRQVPSAGSPHIPDTGI